MDFSRQLSCFALFTVPAFAQDTASVSGVVVDAAERTALPGVHIQLISTNANPTPYGTTSDAEGRFSFAGIPAGGYSIVPRRSGMAFQRLDPGEPPIPTIIVKSGEHKEVRVGMTRKAVISGRVTDDAGIPIENANIVIESATGAQPGLRFYQQHYQLGTQIRTDDRGEYRLSAPPGSYFVRANLMNAERTLGASAGSGLLTDTYFPSAANAKSAQPVEIQPGRESAHINITMNKKRTLTISGVVTGTRPGWTVVVASAPSIRMHQGIQPDKNGHFTFKNLVPETYMIYAENVSEEIRYRSPAYETKLLDRDVTDLSLAIGELVHLYGHVEIPPGTPPISSVRLIPAAGSIGVPLVSGKVNGEGEFEIEKVNAERYRIAIVPKSTGAYVRTVALNGELAPDQVLDLRRVGVQAKMAITIAIGARIKGTVTGLIVSRGVTVALDATDKKTPFVRQRTALNDHGGYEFEAVPPGRYRIAVVDPMTMSMPMSADEIDAVLAARGEAVEVTGSGDIVKDLKQGAVK